MSAAVQLTDAVRISVARSGAEWDAALTGPGVTPFHRFAWLSAQAAMQGWRLDLLIAKAGPEVVGAVPVVTKAPLIPLAPSLPFPYVGPVAMPGRLPEVLAALRRWQRRSGRLAVHMSFPPEASAGARGALVARGLPARVDTTFVLDVSHGSVEVFESGMARTRRQIVRRAVRAGVEVRPSTLVDLRDDLPAVVAESYGVRGMRSPLPTHLGPALVAHLLHGPRSIALTAMIAGEPAAVLTAIGEGDMLYLATGGEYHRLRSSSPNTALVHAMCVRAIEQGYRSVDFVGRVDDGVAAFKRSFGADEREFVESDTDLVPESLVVGARSAWTASRRLVRGSGAVRR